MLLCYFVGLKWKIFVLIGGFSLLWEMLLLFLFVVNVWNWKDDNMCKIDYKLNCKKLWIN